MSKKKNKNKKIRTLPWCASWIVLHGAIAVLREAEEYLLLKGEVIELRSRINKLESKL